MADLFHSGNARMTNLPVDLQLRTGIRPPGLSRPFLGPPRARTGVFREVVPGGINPPEAAKGAPGRHLPGHGPGQSVRPVPATASRRSPHPPPSGP